MDLAQRIQQTQETSAIEVKDLSGLSLKADLANQMAGTWQILSNFDLYVPGSIRKVLPPSVIGGPFPQRILQFTSYWAEPNNPNGPTLRVVGLDTAAKLYDLITNTLLVDLSPYLGITLTTIPFMEVLPLYFVPFNSRGWMKSDAFALHDFVLKYDPTDGNLYVFAVTTAGISGANEPEWTNLAPVTDGTVVWISQGMPTSARFQENAIVISVPFGGPPIMVVQYRYDPTNSLETPKFFVQQVGYSNPTNPIEVGGTKITPNLDGYTPIAGRTFAYTWNDSNTLHETSPSPIAGKTKITEIDNGNGIFTIAGSILPPLVDLTTGKVQTLESYQQYYLSLPLAQAELALAAGFESIFFYATKDGGSVFYRITELYDPVGNIISNSDGSVSIVTLITLQATYLWQDYTPLPTPQSLQNSVRVYEGGGPINLVPAPDTFDPSAWTIKRGSDMFIVPGDSPDGNAAIEQTGTGSTQGINSIQSIPIPAPSGVPYYFQGYIDATNEISGNVEWDVISGDGLVTYLTLAQTSGVAGFVSGMFVKPADGKNNVRVQAFSHASITSGDIVLWAEPLLVANATVAPTILPFYPTPDDALIIPAPIVLSQGPPPKKTLAIAVFQGSLFVLEAGTFRTWFSISGDFQSFGANAYLVPDSSTAGEPVLELTKAFDRLVLGKMNNVSQVTGNNQTNFAPSPIDPQHGVLAARSSISIGNALFSLLNSGLGIIGLGMYIPAPDQVSIGFRPEDLIGDVIKPLVDGIDARTLRSITLFQPCPAIDNTNNRYLYANRQQQVGPTGWADTVFVGTLTHKGRSIWSTLNNYLPNGSLIITIKEIQLYSPINGQLINGVVASANDGGVYLMFGGTEDGTLFAEAQTWPLPDVSQAPLELRNTIKVFRDVWVEGEQLSLFMISWSVDYGNTWSNPTPILLTPQIQSGPNAGALVKIGATGRQIMFRFTIGGTVATAPTDSPMISYFKVNPDIEGEAQGGNQ